MADLLERDQELAGLDEALEAARAGQGSVVLIAGEAGIGKSTLVTTWLASLDDDVRRHVGWCDDYLTLAALDPLRDIARGAGGDLAEAVARGDTIAVLDAMLDLVDHPLHPTVVVMEDVHWADEASLDVVRYVGRRMEQVHGLLVLTYRDEEVGPRHPLTALLAVLPRTGVRRLHPARFGRDAVGVLAREASIDPDILLATTGGNPFFVTEVVRNPASEVPTTVAEAVLARLRALSSESREAVELLSVVPGPLPVDTAAAIVGDGMVLATAERRGLVVVEDQGVRFRHELARRAVESSLAAVQRRAAHRRVLDVLVEDPSGEASRVLHHAVGCGDDQVIATLGSTAARQAHLAGANREAVRLHEHVLAVVDRLGPAEQARIREEHAWGLYAVHRFDEAVVQAEGAVRLRRGLGDPDAVVGALGTWSRMLYLANRPDEALAAAEAAVTEAGPSSDPAVRAEATLARASLLALLGNHDEEARKDARQVLSIARELGRTDLESLALNYAAVATYWKDPAAQVEAFEQALDVALHGRHLEAAARAYTNMVSILVWLRDDRAWQLIDEGLGFMADHDFASHRYNLLGQRALLLVEAGRWNEAEDILEGLLAEVDDAGLLELVVLQSLAGLHVRRGDDDAEELSARAWTGALETRAAQYIGPIGAIRLQQAWLTADPDTALAVRDTLVTDGVEPWTLGELQVYLHRLGLAAPDAWPTQEGMPAGWAAILDDDWEASAMAWEAHGNPYEQGLALIESGQPGPTRRGLEVLTGLGAAPAVRFARARLRDLGVRVVPRGPQAATRDNPAGLTNRQVEVLELVARELTNAEIADRLVLSVRTVDHHVSAILGKLDVSSRHEAAELAADLLG